MTKKIKCFGFLLVVLATIMGMLYAIGPSNQLIGNIFFKDGRSGIVHLESLDKDHDHRSLTENELPASCKVLLRIIQKNIPQIDCKKARGIESKSILKYAASEKDKNTVQLVFPPVTLLAQNENNDQVVAPLTILKEWYKDDEISVFSFWLLLIFLSGTVLQFISNQFQEVETKTFMLRIVTYLIGVFLLSMHLMPSLNFRVDKISLIIYSILFLMSIIDSLSEFDFWGLRGRKISRELLEKIQKIETGDSVAAPQSPVPASGQPMIRLMGDRQGNFLTIIFEIERLLRHVAETLYKTELADNYSIENVTKILHEKGFILDKGMETLKIIRGVRNNFVHGNGALFNENALAEAISVAWTFYAELYNKIIGKNVLSLTAP